MAAVNMRNGCMNCILETKRKRERMEGQNKKRGIENDLKRGSIIAVRNIERRPLGKDDKTRGENAQRRKNTSKGLKHKHS